MFASSLIISVPDDFYLAEVAEGGEWLVVSAVVFHGEAGLHPHHVAGVLAFGLAEGRQAKDVVFPYLDTVGILHVGLLAERLGVDVGPVAAVAVAWLVVEDGGELIEADEFVLAAVAWGVDGGVVALHPFLCLFGSRLESDCSHGS